MISSIVIYSFDINGNSSSNDNSDSNDFVASVTVATTVVTQQEQYVENLQALDR